LETSESVLTMTELKLRS